VAGAENFEQLRPIAYFCGPSAFRSWPFFFFWQASLIAFSLQFVSVVLVVVDGKVFPSLLLPVLPVFQLNGEIRRRKHIVSN